MAEDLNKSKSKNFERPLKKFQAGMFVMFPINVMHLRIWLAPVVICILAPKLIIVFIEENERMIVVIESTAVEAA